MRIPRGLILIGSSSGIPESAIDDLVRHANDAYRSVDLFTDSDVSVEVETDAVSIRGSADVDAEAMPSYDIIFVAGFDKRTLIRLRDEYGGDGCWTCWAKPRSGAEMTDEELSVDAHKAFSDGISAVWGQRVKGAIGPLLDAISTDLRGVFSTPSPEGNWTTMWKVFFRASGKYTARIESRHFDL